MSSFLNNRSGISAGHEMSSSRLALSRSGSKLGAALLALACLILAGCSSSVSSPSPSSANSGITFSPSTVNCAAPVDFTRIIKLPASVQDGDTLTIELDGKTEGPMLVSPFGSTVKGPDGSVIDSDTIAKGPDGGWSDTNTISATEVQSLCAGGATYGSHDMFTPGTRITQVLDAKGSVLASGSYSVTETGASVGSAATPAPKLTTVSYVGQILFSTGNPADYAECAAPDPITSVSADIPVYVTYIFGETTGTNIYSYAVTKNGNTSIAAISIPTSYSTGSRCFLDEHPAGYGPGAYHFILYTNFTVIAVADLTVK